jgi:uncharacterized protein (TIGR02421 family)
VKVPSSQRETISPELIADVSARLEKDQDVHRALPHKGRLNLDRRLPFLCIYRQPPDRTDQGARQLVSGEAAYLIGYGDEGHRRELSLLIRKIAETAAAQFGSFLVLEIWSAPDREASPRIHPESGEHLPAKPAFKIVSKEPLDPFGTVGILAGALRKLSLHKQAAEVTIDRESPAHPPEMKPLLTAAECKRIGCHVIGVEVRPVYRDPVTGEVFPTSLRRLRRVLGRALKQAFYTFAHRHTNVRPQHYYALGRRTLVKAVWDVDRKLAAISDSFDFLLQATPINADAAWREFKRSEFEMAPTFQYRPLAVDPVLLKRRLYAVPIERIEDATIAHLFRQKQDELDRKITMLSDVGTQRFLPGSLQVYGGIEPSLLQLAKDLLRKIPSRSRDPQSGPSLPAREFRKRAEEEIKLYRSRYAAFDATAVVRDDIYNGLLVSNGDLLIGRNTRIAASRVDALLHHEIGTHSVTYYNGLSQPLQQLHAGLAGYDGLQEGLAVLSEYLVGGLSRPRLRLLAARVVAIHELVEGTSFVDTFRLLDDTYDFAKRTAFTITMRVYRAGGLTKDAVYLRGLVEILDYLQRGGELEPLFIGKIAVDHIPIIKELLHRRVLHAPPLRPRYLDNPRVIDKLARLADGVSVLDLAKV